MFLSFTQSMNMYTVYDCCKITWISQTNIWSTKYITNKSVKSHRLSSMRSQSARHGTYCQNAWNVQQQGTKILIFPWFSHGFSHGFPMVFPHFSDSSGTSPATTQRPRPRPAPRWRRPRRRWRRQGGSRRRATRSLGSLWWENIGKTYKVGPPS